MTDAFDVALVFPAAHERGGVERITWDLAHYLLNQGQRVAFIGQELQAGADPRLHFAQTASPRRRGVGSSFRFKAAARAALAELGPVRNLVTLGANCPPGDVCMVQSVHRSWLRSAKTVPIKGRPVPAQVRYAMPRHQALLVLESMYFRSPRPRVFVCTSPREARDLRDIYQVPSSRLKVIPNGFDAKVFSSASSESRKATRLSMGVLDEDIVLLLMANELHRKGLAVLLDAVSSMANPKVRVDVVGKVGLDAYSGQIADLGLAGRVFWHGPTRDAASFYAAADLLVLPTQYEPFGLVIVEALATGLPVITTRLAGASNAIKPGVNGLLMEDAHSSLELAGLIRDALQPGILEQWRRTAPASVKDFSQDRIFADVLQLLR